MRREGPPRCTGLHVVYPDGGARREAPVQSSGSEPPLDQTRTWVDHPPGATGRNRFDSSTLMPAQMRLKNNGSLSRRTSKATNRYCGSLSMSASMIASSVLPSVPAPLIATGRLVDVRSKR